MKLDSKPLALAGGIMLSIVSLICAVLLLVVPTFAFSLFGTIVHGIDLAQIAKEVTLGSVLIGLIVTFVFGYLFGWFLAVFYNAFTGK